MDIFKKLGGSGFLKRSSKDIDRYKTELNAKVLFVGNFCGKSALIWAQVLGHKNLDNFIDPPIFECHKYSVTLRPYTIHMEIQDTRGQEDYARLNPLYYLTSDIIVMLFQIGNPDTLHNLEASYQPEINRHGKHKPRLVVGCQLDQRHDPTIINELLKVSEAPVSQTQGINMAKKLGAWGYAECSARDYNGVAEVFDTIAQMVVAIRMQPRVERPMPFFVVLPEHSDVGTTAAANDLPIAANIGSQTQDYDSAPRSNNVVADDSHNSEFRPNNLALDGSNDPAPRSNNIATQENEYPMYNNMVSQDGDSRPRGNNLVPQGSVSQTQNQRYRR